MTNARCCLYQIASVWICRFFLADILSTLFLDPLITYTENHVMSNGRIQKILNFEEAEEFLHEGFV